MDEQSNNTINLRLVRSVVAVATIGGFMFGYDSGVINGTQKGIEVAFSLDRLGVGINVGAILLGSAIGAFAAGRLSDRIGRRGVMQLAAILFFLSAFLAGGAPNSAIFIIARIVGGLGVGAASVISPQYISEVVPADIRGRLVSLQQVMIIAGLTGAFLVNFLVAYCAGGSTATLWGGMPAWRWMFWLQALPASIYYATLRMIPESPRYLVIKRRSPEASGVLRHLFGTQNAARKLAEIEASIAADFHRPRLADLRDLATGRIRPVIWVGIGLAVFQQFVGINVIFYYGTTLWQSVGLSESDALKTNVLSGVLATVSCLVAMGAVDKIGRKPLLLIGSAGMAITLMVVAVAFSSAGTVSNGVVSLSRHVGLLTLVAANLYVMFFNFSWGPVMWVMLGEMFPNQIRGSGLAVSGFAQWFANAAVSVTFPILAIRPGLCPTYIGYSIFALLSFIFVRRFVEETRGRELEEMQG